MFANPRWAAIVLAAGIVAVPPLVSSAAAAELEIFHRFGMRDGNSGRDGASPEAGLILAQDGKYYGVTSDQGITPEGYCCGQGTLYRIGQDGYFEHLQTFQMDPHGAWPAYPLMQASDGTIYGTAPSGGQNSWGTLFRFSNDTFTVLHHFGYAAGGSPRGALVQGADGALYGTLGLGGTNGDGSIFRFKEGEGFSELHPFAANDQDDTDPQGLMLSADGFFYGVTAGDGANNAGTIFRVSAQGDFEVLHEFSAAASEQPNVDGKSPQGRLLEDASGNLYGVARLGGANGSGAVFKFTKPAATVPPLAPTPGTVTLLHSFGPGGYESTAAGGTLPGAGLLLASDGMLYGTTTRGNEGRGGGVFRLARDGTGFESLAAFTTGSNAGIEGFEPTSQLLQGPDGSIYGATGAPGVPGTVFRLNLGLGTPTPIAPPTVQVAFTPSAIKSNEKALLSWGSDNAYYFCQMSGAWNSAVSSQSPDWAEPSQWPVGTHVVTLTCQNEGGSASATAELVVDLYQVPQDSSLAEGGDPGASGWAGAMSWYTLALLLGLMFLRVVVMGRIELPTSAL